ncbi:hypothetical protein ACFQV8_23900 [Pseudonocardia benzenivorans]
MTGRVAGTVRAAGRPLDDAVLTLTDGAGRQVARVVETPAGCSPSTACRPAATC